MNKVLSGRVVGMLFLTAFLFLCFEYTTFSSSPVRVVKFINLTEKENKPFSYHRRELAGVVMKGIEDGIISVYQNSYRDKFKSNEISIGEYYHLIEYNNRKPLIDAIPKNVYYLFPSDIALIGLDQTRSIKDSIENIVVHYVNFYGYGDDVNEKCGKRYLFSVTWNDFVKVLEAKKDMLYVPNTTCGLYWRGDVLLTNGQYVPDVRFNEGLWPTLKSQHLNVIDIDKPSVVLDSKALFGKYTDEFQYDMFIGENKTGGFWQMNDFVIGSLGATDYITNEGFSYSNLNRYRIRWSDVIEKTLIDSLSKTYPIYTMANAFLLGYFKYSTDIKPVEVKGGFLEIHKSAFMQPSFKTTAEAVSSKYFHTQYDEQLYLKDSANTHLEIDGHGLVEIIYEALLNKALTAYYNDSLSIVLSFIELNSMASVQPPNIDFRLPTICEVGDTIEIRISNFNSKYFIIGKSFNSETLTYEEYVEVSKFFKPYVPPLYTSKDIYIIELNQRVSFDLNGKNKKYNLESIGLFVPADHPLNYKHIQYQICAVRWDEVKNILLKDKRSMISYNGKLVNLVDVIEDRQFLSSFLKTGFLEVGE